MFFFKKKVHPITGTAGLPRHEPNLLLNLVLVCTTSTCYFLKKQLLRVLNLNLVACLVPALNFVCMPWAVA
eukprot:SAG31_NODE_1989_length_6721_cov_5.737391_4_plen_71_part_00